MAFNLYLLYVVSIFLRFPQRIPLLGIIHFDLILICLITVMIFLSYRENENTLTRIGRLLLILSAFIIIALPLAEWPGTVLKKGIPLFIKGIVFYFFTVSLIRTERQFKVFMLVFIICQTIRILEPLYLHYTADYWGGRTTMELNRLAGGPYDVINPNGLAEVTAFMLPFYYFLGISSPWWMRLLYFGLIPLSLNALILTGSRSGLIAMLVVVGGIIMRSKRKFLLLIVVIVAALSIAGSLSDIQKDRYRSISDHQNVRFGRSAEGRIDGVISNIKVALQKPFVGHGLGTSLEVNVHKVGFASPSHNLYAEIMQELGLIGLIIFLLFIWNIHKNFRETRRAIKANEINNKYLVNVSNALEVWLWMNIIFSFASYGLSTWQWYLCGGLSVVVGRLLAHESRVRDVVISPHLRIDNYGNASIRSGFVS